MEELKKELQTLLGSIHHNLDQVQETMDRGFERVEVQAKDHFEQLVAKIDEMTLETTKRIEEDKKRFDELMKLT